MALDYDYLSASTRENFIPQVADNIYNSSAMFKMFDIDGRIKTYLKGGTKVSEGLEYEKQAGGTYKKWDLLDNTPPDNLTRADFDWGDYYAPISISGDDEDQNTGDEQIIDLVKSRTKGAEKKIKDLMSNDMFSGAAGANGYIGLDTMIGTGSVGGIDGASYSWWVSGVDATSYTEGQLVDSTDTDAYFKRLLQKAMRTAMHMNEEPNLIVTTPLIWDIYESVLEEDARYVKTGRGQKLASAGFPALAFRESVPVIKDELCPAGHMYVINTNYLYLRTHKRTNYLFDPFTKVANQRGRHAHIFHKACLTITNRRMFYKFTGLPTS